jgi:hypothetical protein
MMLLVNTGPFQDNFRPVSGEELPGGKALALSAPDLHVHVLAIPPVSGGRRDEEIKSQLLSRYPGDLEDTAVCYTLGRIRRDKESPYRTAAVFLMDSKTLAAYRAAGKTIIPLLAVLEAGFRGMKGQAGRGKPVLIVFLSKIRLEAARFEDGELRGYVTFGIHAGETAEEVLSLPLVHTLYEDTEANDMPVLLISREDDTAEEDSKTKKLRDVFPNCGIIAFDKLIPAINIKKSSIFGASAKKPEGFRSFIILLLLASLFLLFGIFRNFGARARHELQILESVKTEKLRNKSEAEKILEEIAAHEKIKEKDAASNGDEAGIYTVIEEIHACLAGAWVRSLNIDEDRFSLEAEGADSVTVLQGLEKAGCFYNAVLHQAFPSAFRGERFSISGRIHRGKE